MEEKISTILERLKQVEKYQIFDEYTLMSVCEDAAFLYCRLRNVNADTIEFTSSELNWIKRCTIDFLEKKLMDLPSGVVKYSENGYSLEFSSDTISRELLREVVPYVGVIEC